MLKLILIVIAIICLLIAVLALIIMVNNGKQERAYQKKREENYIRQFGHEPPYINVDSEF